MNLLLATQLLGWLLVLVGAFQLVPVLAALIFGEPVLPYVTSAGMCVAIGLPVALGVRPESLRIRPRDGFLIVSIAWLLASLFGALPYLTSGVLSPVDAFFESVAGFTTTGSTVMTGIEGHPRALLLWRSLTQWLGGMGIVVFTVALMPLLGIGGMQLFKAEVPGPVKEKVTPRVAQTARQLWLIYVGLTAAECFALLLAGMSPFDALCHSLTTLSTGGFSTRSASVGAYQSPAIEWIVIVFMILAGMNFVLHYRLLQGRVREALSDVELRYFLGVLGVSTLIVLSSLLFGPGAGPDATDPGAGLKLADALRAAAFTCVSLVTTTGYATADFEGWPSLATLVLLHLMVLGAMAGSTSGGVKSLRAILSFRAVRTTFIVSGHRRAVRPAVRYAGKAVQPEVLAGVWTFFAVYFLLVALAAMMVAAYGYDLLTAISAGVTAVGNVGPGLSAIGPFDDFAHFPAPVKLFLAGCMIAGRLELFTLLILLTPGFWRS
ncbi:MAG: TrkH family potassium uptake protein [Deltaproteobacteria bacterium]|nr:TrkH family potassium uptake protein [Deltaproteobacteria bacterium]MBW2417655.1 TrkH family potassium uptake protein [Deltaproteobacteria bacterium]